MTNITKEIENEICSKYSTHTSSQLAKEYDVAQSKVTNIWTKYGLKGKKRQIYSLNEEYFDVIDDSNKAYFLGFICADGCLFKNKNKQDVLRITIHRQDEYILEEFLKLIQTNKPIYRTSGKYSTIEIVSDKIVKSLNKIGIFPNKTYGNTIPNISEQFELDFIRGYIDGDGHITPKTGENMRVAISGYESNMLKIASMLENRNILSSFMVDKRKEYKNGSFGELAFSNKLECYCLLKLLYQNELTLKLYRKYKNAIDFIEHIENSNKKSDKEMLIYYKYAVQKVG